MVDRDVLSKNPSRCPNIRQAKADICGFPHPLCGVKKYHVSFNNNFIFYKKNSNDNFRDSLKYFISEYDKGLYENE